MTINLVINLAYTSAVYVHICACAVCHCLSPAFEWIQHYSPWKQIMRLSGVLLGNNKNCHGWRMNTRSSMKPEWNYSRPNYCVPCVHVRRMYRRVQVHGGSCVLGYARPPAIVCCITRQNTGRRGYRSFATVYWEHGNELLNQCDW